MATQWLNENIGKLYMNNTTKSLPNQRKITRNQLIEIAQQEWLEENKLLIQKKAIIGYADITWEVFLTIIPSGTQETSLQSKIIELQERYKNHKERQKIIWLEDEVIVEFNRSHAIVRVGQTFILTQKIDIFGRHDFSLESRQSFITFYEDERIICIDGVERSKAEIWLKSPKRRKYKGIIFDPSTTESDNGYYNLWKGFTRNPQKGNCSKYWQHVYENICNNDEENYQYLRKWLAYIFQKPHIVHTAIALCGSQGVGKNSFVEPLGILLGIHFIALSNISELISNFNDHLKYGILIHANEALWGGYKKDIGTVKAMITEPTCLIEGKGKDRIEMRNFKHVILSSNEDFPVHLDTDDRRFLVLKIAEYHKEDVPYFKAIKDELENGGYEALLYDLLQEDISNFNPRTLTSSSNSFSIKMRSADSSYRYLYEALREGGFSIGKEEGLPVWQTEIPKSSIYEDYVAWCQKNGEDFASNALLGRTINKLIISLEETRPGSAKARIRQYKLPSLDQAREDFCTAFKEKPERIFFDEN